MHEKTIEKWKRRGQDEERGREEELPRRRLDAKGHASAPSIRPPRQQSPPRTACLEEGGRQQAIRAQGVMGSTCDRRARRYGEACEVG